MSFSDRLLFVMRLFILLSVNFSHFHLLSNNHRANFNQTWYKASLVEGNSSLFEWRAMPFSKEIFLRTTGPISTKRCTKYSWVNGDSIQKALALFTGGNDWEIARIHWQHFSKLLQNHWANFNQFALNTLEWKGFNILKTGIIRFSKKEIIFFLSPNQS